MRHEPTGRVSARTARLHPGLRLRPGKLAWLAMGWPRAGTAAAVPNAGEIARRVEALLGDTAFRSQASARGQELVDGQGALRVAELLA